MSVTKKTFYLLAGMFLLAVSIILLAYSYFSSQRSSIKCDTYQDRYPRITCGLFTISPDNTLYLFVGVLRGTKLKNNEAHFTVEMKDKKGQKITETFILPAEPYKIYWKKLSKAKVELKKDGQTITHGSVFDTNTQHTASGLARLLRPNTEIILSVVDTPQNELPDLKKKFGNLKMYQCEPYIAKLAADLANPTLKTRLDRFLYKTMTGCSAYAQLITTF